MSKHRTWVEINSRALTSNIENLQSLLNERARFCAVLKANAYGHGLNEVASIVSSVGVDAFAVDNIDDALVLRDVYPSALIIVLGYVPNDRLKDALNADIQITLYDKEGIECANSTAKEIAKRFPVHVKVETGTSRQGVLEEDLPDMIRLLKRNDMVDVRGISTHFANIEDTDDPTFATKQFNDFQKAVKSFVDEGLNPEWRHCACSAAIILYPDTHLSLVRAGISLYGIWSSEMVQNTVRSQNFHCELEPVLTWKSRIAQIKPIKMGTPIGYGLTEVMKRSGRIAVVPVGYWDGYDRKLSSVGEVLIRGVRCKVMGRVCMNMIVVDVSQVPSVAKDDDVVLLGTDGRHKITADEIARKCDTIAYEIVSRINPSLPRVII